MPPKKTRDLIIQTTDGKIYMISEEHLGEPIGGDPAGIRKLRTALATVRGQTVGLRAAVMGYPLPAEVGANAHVSVVEAALSKHVERNTPSSE